MHIESCRGNRANIHTGWFPNSVCLMTFWIDDAQTSFSFRSSCTRAGKPSRHVGKQNSYSEIPQWIWALLQRDTLHINVIVTGIVKTSKIIHIHFFCIYLFLFWIVTYVFVLGLNRYQKVILRKNEEQFPNKPSLSLPNIP